MGPWNYVGIGTSFSFNPDDSQQFYRGQLNVPLLLFNMRLTDPQGVVIPGLKVDLPGGGAPSVTDANGVAQLQLPNGPGLLSLSFTTCEKPSPGLLSVPPASLSRFTQTNDLCYTNSLEVPYDFQTTNYGAYKFDYPKTVERTTCTCSPWCAIGATTVDGVQTVLIKAGVNPRRWLMGAQITITGPGGVHITDPNDLSIREKFSPAADGTWTVTATMCGVTNTCTITLP